MKNGLGNKNDLGDFDKSFSEAFKFAFKEVFVMWYRDLRKIFNIGTRSKSGGCNLSVCILVMIGIESFSKFFSSKKKKGAFEEFVNKYFDGFYQGRMGRIYELFRHGLAHYFYPKSDYRNQCFATIAFHVDEKNKVLTLRRIKDNLSYHRSVQKLNPPKGKRFYISPQVLFLDTVQAINNFKKDLLNEDERLLRKRFICNYKRIKRELGHHAFSN